MTVRGPAPASYTKLAVLLHWLTALGIGTLVLLGLAMTQIPLGLTTQFRLYQLHKSVGITVLLVVLVRIVWRLAHRPPPLPDAMPAIERLAARKVHLLLYVLMVGLPLSGWALVSASPFNLPTVLYGLLPWPSLPVLSTLSEKAPVEAVLKLVHAYGAWALIVLIAVHACAAARHQFILRDGLLLRMWPSQSWRRP